MTQRTLGENPPPTAPAARSASMGRFTLDGSEELEEHLARTCNRVADGIRSVVPRGKLNAVLLGGGYGRGEGGVLRTENGDLPYNDLECYVCLRGNRLLNERRYAAPLRALGGGLSRAAGVDVEFKVFSLSHLRRSPVNMFYYDLVMGHHWLMGDESLLAGCEHHRAGHRIPLAEATRLLMNRCSGLLFAAERLQREPFTADDADFVARNVAKAQLALGDAVLTVHGEYHWSCLERHQRLKELACDARWYPEVLRHHAAGVAFKLHPMRGVAPLADLGERHGSLLDLAKQLWFWLEGIRLNSFFGSPRDYAFSVLDKCPESPLWRNVLVNVKTFGPGVLLEPGCLRHPRERVLHALTLLLWESAVFQSRRLMGKVQHELKTSRRHFTTLVQAYEAIWRCCN